MADVSIGSIREKYPQYGDMSDAQLAEGLHKKFYSDMAFDTFAGKIGYTADVGQHANERAGEQAASSPVWTEAGPDEGVAQTRGQQSQVGADVNSVAQGLVGGTGALVAGAGEGYQAGQRRAGVRLQSAMDLVDQGDIAGAVKPLTPIDRGVLAQYIRAKPDDRAAMRGQMEQDTQEASGGPNMVTRAGEAVKTFSNETFPVDPKLEGIQTGVGRLLGGIAPALVAGAAGSAVGGPVGGVLAGAAVISSQAYDGTYNDAISKGATREAAESAAGDSAVAQSLMAVPVFRLTARVPMMFREGLAKTLTNLGLNGIEFGTANGLSKFVDNYVAQQYDPGRSLMEGTGEAGLEGAIAGLIIPAVGGIARRATRSTPEDVTKAPTVDAAIEVAQEVASEPAAPAEPRVDPVSRFGQAPDFMSPNAEPRTIPRIMELLNEDSRIAANRPDFMPPNASIDPLTGKVSTVEQPSIPKSWGDLFAAKPSPDPRYGGDPGPQSRDATVPDEATSGPRSVGAAASREQTDGTTFGRTAREIRGAHADMELADIMRTPQPGDARDIIPGATQTKAEIELTPSVSRAAKGLRQEFREGFNDHEKELNEIYHRHVDDRVPPREQVATMEDLRSDNWEFREKTVFGPKTDGDPVSVAPTVKHLQQVLANPVERRNSYLKKEFAPLLAELIDKTGQPIELGSKELYGIRKELSRKVKDMATNPDLAHLRDEFRDLMTVIDNNITIVAPEYRTMMDEYRAASIPINEATRLQDIRLKITNGSDRVITFGQFDRYMRGLWLERHGPNPYAPAKDISQGTWDRLMLLHERLARSASADELARVKGSDTNQLMMEMVRKGTLGVAHLAAAKLTGGMGNLVIPYITKQIDQRRAEKAVGEHLNPDLSKYANPGP